jgi:hypothetical protein
MSKYKWVCQSSVKDLNKLSLQNGQQGIYILIEGGGICSKKYQERGNMFYKRNRKNYSYWRAIYTYMRV